MVSRTFAALLAACTLLAACGGVPNEPNDFPPPPPGANLTTTAEVLRRTSTAAAQLPTAPNDFPSPPPDAQLTITAAAQLRTIAASLPTATLPRRATVTPPPTLTEPPVATTPISATTTPISVTVTPAPAAFGEEVLFLRGGNLIALDVASRQERKIAENVVDFVASADGALIALVRGAGLRADLWLVRRDGSDLRQLTSDDRADAAPAFAPDAQALAFASSVATGPRNTSWPDWSTWCGQSEVRVIDLATATVQSVAPGCDPVFAPDGRRMAFSAPPTVALGGLDFTGSGNTIRIVNRQGQNGWNFASAGDETKPESGYVVYAPAFDQDGKRLAYQRFLGERALTDLSYTEIGGSFSAQQHQLLALGFGWLDAVRFSPAGMAAMSENNYSDARGAGGYLVWSVWAIQISGQRDVLTPSGDITMLGTEVGHLKLAQRAAWSPNGTELVVQLPPGWNPDADNNDPRFGNPQPGELWRWTPGTPPTARLAQQVDFASPVVWLPVSN